MADYLKRAPMHRPEATEKIRATVFEMLSRIERRGAEEIRRYSKSLDGWDPPSFRVTEAERSAAAKQVPDELRSAIELAQAQIRGFAEAQLETMSELSVETLPGIVLGHRLIPVGSVGAYVPGGRYPMLASAFMTVLVPKVAGVERVVACAPPQPEGGIHPAMLYAIASSGADEILCIGGVQALAAMAYGLDDGLDPVAMIIGPGNAYVAEAKRQLFGRVGIDLLAGPTEILVIADRTADPELVAADLLGQAEHGPTSPAILISTSRRIAERTLAEVERLLDGWPTAEIAGEAWRRHGTVAVVADREEAIELADRYAAEHVEVHAREPDLERYLYGLRNYGSLFLGEQTTVVYGDKVVGTNHVLPTMGAARYTGGLWVGKFLKTCTYQRVTAEGGERVAPAAARISEAERFGGHALTARMRIGRFPRASSPTSDRQRR